MFQVRPQSVNKNRTRESVTSKLTSLSGSLSRDESDFYFWPGVFSPRYKTGIKQCLQTTHPAHSLKFRLQTKTVDEDRNKLLDRKLCVNLLKVPCHTNVFCFGMVASSLRNSQVSQCLVCLFSVSLTCDLASLTHAHTYGIPFSRLTSVYSPNFPFIIC